MEERNLFPSEVTAVARLMIVNFGKNEQSTCLEILKEIRMAGISAEYYPDAVKLKKQMSYANAKQIPFVLLVGEEEIKTRKFTLKDMISGDQEKLSVKEIIEKLK
jgi:histidyl-tRNA synthetase